MAKSLSDSFAIRRQVASNASLYSLKGIVSLRLITGCLVTLGSIIFLLGVGWDIQWHEYVGRDRTLIPPHIMMLSGVTLSGLAALVCVLIETGLARRNTDVARVATSFSDIFHSTSGAYLAGFAALNAAVAFPLDSYWHSLYGIDVSILAPFHVMFLLGMALVALGGVFMLVSTANLATRLRLSSKASFARIAALCSVAAMFGLLAVLAMGNTLFYGIIIGFIAGWLLFMAVNALEWRWAATITSIFFGLFALISLLAIPTAMTTLMHLEGLSLRGRAGNPYLSLLAQIWPLGIVVGAVLFDVLRIVGKRRGWSSRWLTGIVLIVLGVLSSYFFCWLGFSALTHHVLSMSARLSLQWPMILPAILAAWLGSRIGSNMGTYLRGLEQ